MTDCHDETGPTACSPPSGDAPVRCLEAFNGITEKLGGMSAKLDAIHHQALRTNGHVEQLFQRTGRHETQIQLLRADVRGGREGLAQWGRRIWQLVIGLALLLAGYLIKQ
jgi:hypothetical protein